MEKLKGGAVGDYAKKLVVMAYGFAGEGKTTLGLTFPSPLNILNCGDRDMKPLLDKLPGHYEINYEWLPFTLDALTPAVANKMLATAMAMRAFAVKTGGTFFVDAADLLSEIASAALVDTGGTALKYKPLNEWMFSFWGAPITAPDLQICMTAMATEIWNGPSSTGKFKPAGWKHLDRYIETQVRMFHKENLAAGEKPTASTGGVTHCGYIEESKKNEMLLRRVFDNPTFGMLYKMTFGTAWPEEDKLWSPA